MLSFDFRSSDNICHRVRDARRRSHGPDFINAEAALIAAGESLLGPLLDELAKGVTPEELQARLVELYPCMDTNEPSRIFS